jgi:hypothetical protein
MGRDELLVPRAQVARQAYRLIIFPLESYLGDRMLLAERAG